MARRKKRSSSKKTFWWKLTHLFQPQKSNRYRSKLLHPESLMILSVILIAFFALFNAIRFFPSISDKVLGFASNIDVNQVLIETNEERSALGLEELTINEELNQAALAKAQDMFDDQYWAHVAPDGKEPWDFIKDVDYVYKYAGENLARDFDSSQEVINAWMNSPTHKENIVNPNFTQMGLAVVNGNLKGFNTTLVVQMFATPGSIKLKTLGAGSEFHLPKTAEVAQTDLQAVAGDSISNNDLVISPLQLTKAFFLTIIMIIVLTLFYDAFVSNNRRYKRIVGQNFAHVLLFLSVAFLIALFKGGTIAP